MLIASLPFVLAFFPKSKKPNIVGGGMVAAALITQNFISPERPCLERAARCKHAHNDIRIAFRHSSRSRSALSNIQSSSSIFCFFSVRPQFVCAICCVETCSRDERGKHLT